MWVDLQLFCVSDMPCLLYALKFYHATGLPNSSVDSDLEWAAMLACNCKNRVSCHFESLRSIEANTSMLDIYIFYNFYEFIDVGTTCYARYCVVKCVVLLTT